MAPFFAGIKPYELRDEYIFQATPALLMEVKLSGGALTRVILTLANDPEKPCVRC